MIINSYSCPAFLSHSRILLATWDLKLSYWKTISYKSSFINISIYSSKYCFNILIYIFFLIFSSMNIIGFNLLFTKYSYIICDILLSHFFSITFFERYFSLLFWYLQIHIILILLFFLIADSSDHIILSQSSRIQYWYFLTHSKYFFVYTLINNILFNTLYFRIFITHNWYWIIFIEIEIL